MEAYLDLDGEAPKGATNGVLCVGTVCPVLVDDLLQPEDSE